MNKDVRKVVKALERQGFDVVTTANGHLMVSKGGEVIAVLAGTASDWRSLLNGLAPLKRAGFRWPPRR
ncbi:hypothetical protein [uncultured Pseudokineococcus sp.]|uniref:hypothetical protein n=1 Tax=uncultured Pseudokineococcus sp. TaxID=1642928 RepID=UPI00263A363C|nr:hypothetical protein [uncultured Pseudokineococcus sp.]